jgi:hypothetical protein
MRALLPAGAAPGGVQKIAPGFLFEAADLGLLGFLLAALGRLCGVAGRALALGFHRGLGGHLALEFFQFHALAAALLGLDALFFLRLRGRSQFFGDLRIDRRRRLVLELLQHRLFGGFGGFAAFVVVLKAHSSSFRARIARSALESDVGFGRST